MNMGKNLLFYGDNLDVLRRHIASDSVDLVYLDPPFNSQQDYNVLFAEHGIRSAAQIKAFSDTWQWDQAAAHDYQATVEAGGSPSLAMQAFRTLLGPSDMLAYLAMMAPRLKELQRALRPTGSLYLHCDPTASHYLKLLLDSIFGPKNFLGEIIWRRTASHTSSRRWPRLHDVLLHFAKDAARVRFTPARTTPDPGWVEREYRFEDERGRYSVDNLTGAGTRKGPSGLPWRGIDPATIGSGRHWRYHPDKLDAEGRIYWPAKGQYPKLKQYAAESGGASVGDLWTDIPVIGRTAAERLGYPTQKPEALLERIITASSGEGDTVLDPFCGCGTAVAVAQRLGRRWIGIDITYLAISLIKHRLQNAYGEEVAKTYDVIGEPTTTEDAQALAHDDPYQFQWWAVGLVGARATERKKGADQGVDGRLYFHDEAPNGKTKQVILSVKAGQATVAHLRDLRGVIDRERAQIGALISMHEPTQPMRTEAASAGFYRSPWTGRDYPRLQLRTIAELLDGKGIDYPAIGGGNVTFKKAPRAAEAPGEQLSLG
jgi:DNA modification methylase